MHDFTVWVSYGKWRKNWAIRYCLLHLIHLSSTRLRRCGRILSGICEPYCLITPDLTMHYYPILILINYIKQKIMPDSIVYTDSLGSYDKLDVSGFIHYRINHPRNLPTARTILTALRIFGISKTRLAKIQRNRSQILPAVLERMRISI